MQNKDMNKKRFFITGGMGYIGSAFAREALRLGHDVCLYDSLIYEQDRIRIYNEITANKDQSVQCQFILGDTRNIELLKSSVKIFAPTHFMHWGDLSSVYSCNHNPIFTEDVGYNATVNIIELCSSQNIPLFYNSSSSVYGVQVEERLMTEADPIPTPTDLYTATKLRVEDYIEQKILKNPNFKAIIFRPATAFGLSPRFRIELLPNHFTWMGITSKVIKVADLNAYRAAIDLKDLINGYFSVINKGTWSNLKYNIGDHNMSKLEFALGIQKVIGCKIITIEDIGDLRNLQIDCSLFKNEFEFKPSNDYIKSVQKIADWLEKNKEKIVMTKFTEMLNMPLSSWLKIST